jgi:hypothetical protein
MREKTVKGAGRSYFRAKKGRYSADECERSVKVSRIVIVSHTSHGIEKSRIWILAAY